MIRVRSRFRINYAAVAGSDSLVTPDGFYGTGADGNITLANGSGSTVAGISRSGAVWTMSRHVQAANLTINDGVELRTKGYGLLVNGTLTLVGTGRVGADGNQYVIGSTAVNIATSGVSGGTAYFHQGTAAGAVASEANGNPGVNQSVDSLGGNGGNGGTTGVRTGGSGGVCTRPSPMPSDSTLITHLFDINAAIRAAAVNPHNYYPGAGAGTGGSAGAFNSGAGGVGGGETFVCARYVAGTTSGLISARGGYGGYNTSGDSGSGGGGGGGIVWLATMTPDVESVVTVSVAGGPPGGGTLAKQGVVGSDGTKIVAVTTAASPDSDLYWSNVSLLMPLDGDLTDLKSGLASNYIGDASFTSATSKFGTQCLSSGATNPGVQIISPNAVMNLGSGNWTFELHMRDGSGASSILWGTGTPWSSGSFAAMWRNGGIGKEDNGGTGSYSFGSNAPADGTWRHIAIVRNGSTITSYVDGVAGSSPDTGFALSLISGNAHSFFQVPSAYFANMRLTKGVARYTANFTPPTAKYPTS